MDTREGRTCRGDLQPDGWILRNLDRLEGLRPGLCRLVAQVEAARRSLRVLPDPAKLFANARFGVFCQRDFAPEDTENRQFAPVEGVIEIQVDRPILAQDRARFDLHHGSSLSFAVNAGSEPVGALAFDGSKDRNGADDAIAPPVKRHRSPVDKTVDVTIGLDPKHQHAPIHASYAFVDSGEPPGHVALDRGGDGRKSKFNRRRNP
jgi:hypothetical protein